MRIVYFDSNTGKAYIRRSKSARRVPIGKRFGEITGVAQETLATYDRTIDNVTIKRNKKYGAQSLGITTYQRVKGGYTQGGDRVWPIENLNGLRFIVLD